MILKSWKLIGAQQKLFNNLSLKPNAGFMTLEAQKTWIMTINGKRNWTKNGINCQKFAKIRDVKILQDIPLHLEIKQ